MPWTSWRRRSRVPIRLRPRKTLRRSRILPINRTSSVELSRSRPSPIRPTDSDGQIHFAVFVPRPAMNRAAASAVIRFPTTSAFHPLTGGHATSSKASCTLLKPPAADFPLSIKSSVIVTMPGPLMIFYCLLVQSGEPVLLKPPFSLTYISIWKSSTSWHLSAVQCRLVPRVFESRSSLSGSHSNDLGRVVSRVSFGSLSSLDL